MSQLITTELPGHTSSPNQMEPSQMKLVVDDNINKVVNSKAGDDKKPCTVELRGFKQGVGQDPDGAEPEGLHDVENVDPREAKPRNETASMAVDASPGGDNKVDQDLKLPHAQEKPAGAGGQVGGGGPHLPLTETKDGGHQSFPAPATCQSSYVSFGPMIQEPDGDHIPDATRHEAGTNTEPEGVQTPSKVSKEKQVEQLAAVHKSTQASPAPHTSQPVSSLPWAKDASAPLPKLPIRFVDCIGRYYIFPWHKVKTWKGMKKLIQSAFARIDNLRPHIMAGHYDLIIQDVWVDPIAATIKSTLASHPSQFNPLETALSSFTAAGPSLNTITPTSPPSHLLPKPCKGSTILPELWDDVVEPGMMIKMLAWPGVGRDSASANTQPPQPSQAASSFNWPRRGDRTPPLSILPAPPKGKTRKRQDRL